LIDEITELKQPPQMVVARARDLTDVRFHLEHLMAELHTVRVRYSSGIIDRAEREPNQINSDLEGLT